MADCDNRAEAAVQYRKMKIFILKDYKNYVANLAKPIDLSRPLGGENAVKAWYVSNVKMQPAQIDEWVGSVKEGASVNFFDIKFNPHGNGTHTECFGHISKEKESVNQQFSEFHSFAYLLHLQPIETKNGKIITLKSLQEKNIEEWDFESIIIKTGNYPPGHDFSNTDPAYFEPELMAFLKEKDMRHFLTDLPSVDREKDDGKLLAHKAFWDFPDSPRKGCTISELLQIPEGLEEGKYLLNLQTAPFENDAAPSRPLVFRLKEA